MCGQDNNWHREWYAPDAERTRPRELRKLRRKPITTASRETLGPHHRPRELQEEAKKAVEQVRRIEIMFGHVDNQAIAADSDSNADPQNEAEAKGDHDVNNNSCRTFWRSPSNSVQLRW